MKKLLGILAIAVTFSLFYLNRTVLIATAENIIYHSPCSTPILYRIDTVDERFNLSRNEFSQEILKASDIWNDAYGSKLFEYDPKGELSINLVFDNRQYLTNQINQLDTELENKKSAIQPEIVEYKKRATEFNTKITNLNKEIDYWNSHGGAPLDEYKKLRDTQNELAEEAKVLNQMAISLNQSTSQYNNKINELSQTIEEYNEELKYKPEEGIYLANKNEQKIIIFFNVSETELVHTLAHEMGHALNLPHIPKVTSIMYPRTTQVVTLSQEDTTALALACRKVSIAETLRNKASHVYNVIRTQGLRGILDDIRISNFVNSE